MSFPLFEFAFVKLPDTLDWLASLAEPENWDYRHAPSDNPKPILYSYLQYTFARLQHEGKIAYSPDKSIASINTGLVTQNQEEVYALFVKNVYREDPPFYLERFCKESDRTLLPFGTLPMVAHYFDDPKELLYDIRLPLRKNVDHIIDDNRDRFPPVFASMPENHSLRIALDGAIDHAIRRVVRNYKTAIPQFYQGRVQLLLPLCMTNQSLADLALVVYRQNDVYLASTCLTLDMAYNNARLLARPDTEWLQP